MKKTAADTQPEVLPQEGGSYLRSPDGSLTKVEGTAPADAEAETAEADPQ